MNNIFALKKVAASVPCLLLAGSLAMASDFVIVSPHTGESRLATEADAIREVKAEARSTVTGRRGAGLTWNIVYEDVENDINLAFDDPVAGALCRQALEDMLAQISDVLDYPGVTLDVIVENSEFDGTGALAVGSALFPTTANTFSQTVAQIHLETGTDPTGAFADMYIVVDFMPPWGTGPGPITGSEYDLRTALLHEVMHCLGFASSVISSGDSGTSPGNNARSIFDQFLETGNGAAFFNGTGAFQGTSSWLTGSENGGRFNGALATAANGGTKPSINTPGTFALGTSISHWAPGEGGGEAVMQPAIAMGEMHRELLEFEIQALADMGFNLAGSGVDDWHIH